VPPSIRDWAGQGAGNFYGNPGQVFERELKMGNFLADDMTQANLNYKPVQLRVLGVGASPRAGGNSDILLRKILGGVEEEDVHSCCVQLREFQYQGCVGCERCRKDKICSGLKDGMSLIYPRILESTGLVLVFPG
jgi:hypothetical protein